MELFSGVRIAVAVALACGCGAAAPEPAALAPAKHASAIDAGPSSDEGPSLSEVEARALLEARLRAAGYRILRDVRVSVGEAEVTLDGYDPQRQVGYEYVAAEEEGTDLRDRERALIATDSERRLLIIEATDAAGVVAAVDRFLEDLAAARSSE